MRQKFARLSVDHGIEQDRRLDVVPVVRVVRRCLEPPYELAGIRIERHDRSGPQVRALARLACENRIRVARAPINQVQLGIVGAGHPRHSAAVVHRFLGGPRFRTGVAHFHGRRVPPPLQVASLWIARFQIAFHVHRVAAHTHDDVILDHQRGHRREVLQLLIGNLFAPALFAVFDIERDEPAVRALEIEPVAVHADAALSHQVTALVLEIVLPDMLAGAGVNRENVVGDCEV